MAIDPNLLIVKPVGELQNVTNPTDGKFLYYDGGDNLKTTDVAPFKEMLVTSVKGEANPASSPTAWVDGDPYLFERWGVTTAGTYTNFVDADDDPIVVTTDDLLENVVEIWVTNGVSKKVLTEKQQPTQNIVKFEDFDFPALEGEQVIYTGEDGVGYWQVKTGQTATISDIPSDSSTKWERIGENVTQIAEFIDVVKDDSYTGNLYFANANVFSGFGFQYGVFHNFSRATIKVGQITSTSNLVTEVNLRICENSMSGTELARVTKSVTIAEGVIQDVVFDFPEIANASNANIWVEFWCNGKTGLFFGNIGTVVAYKYKTVSMTYGDFTVQSLDAGGPNYRIYLKLENVYSQKIFKDELVATELEEEDYRPISNDRVAKEFIEYSKVIVDGFVPDSTVIFGTETVNVNTSTFKGWGQLLGILTNFNRVGYVFKAFDATAIPTQVRCVIRKTSPTGDIIFDSGTKSVSLVLNTNKKIYFNLSTTYANGAGDELYVSFFANGMIALMGGVSNTAFDANHTVRYTTVSMSDSATTSANSLYRMYCEVIHGVEEKQVSDAEVARIRGFSTPEVLLTSRAWLYPGFQYNVYNKTTCIPNFGDNLNNYVVNIDSTSGKQTNRGFRLDNIPVSLNVNMSLNLMKGRDVIAQKMQNLVSTTTSNGAGQNRKILVIGDSTVDNDNITTPLTAIFSTDSMAITCIGTRGSTGKKHEGVGGRTIEDLYGPGRTFYKINVTGIVNPPSLNARYTQGANVYNVEEINISGGSGYFSVSIVSGSAPTASGTLTRSSGTGDSPISYASSSTTAGNIFYYATTGMFDLGNYLTTTSQSMGNGDWIFIQLGINDMFAITDLPAAQAKSKTMMTQLNAIINNIHTYNANIRVGIVVTIPCADQDAFAENYTTGQFSEMYTKTGLVTWQKKLIDTLDNTTAINARTYLISAHSNFDAVNNFQTSTRAVNSRNSATETYQSNGVHPHANGYYTMADMYAGIIKYFG